jgi:negative regulator of flagellin synthesis FlgM
VSHTNGIGSLQQLPVVADVATSSTSRIGRTDADTSSGGTQAAQGTTGTDRANVSGTANVVAQALSGSDVRADRVSTLQGAIAAGTYNVPSSDVAAKLLSSLIN